MGGERGSDGDRAVVIIYENTTPKPYVLHRREVRYDRPNAGGAGDPGDETLVGFLHTHRILTQTRSHLRGRGVDGGTPYR